MHALDRRTLLGHSQLLRGLLVAAALATGCQATPPSENTPSKQKEPPPAASGSMATQAPPQPRQPFPDRGYTQKPVDTLPGEPLLTETEAKAAAVEASRASPEAKAQAQETVRGLLEELQHEASRSTAERFEALATRLRETVADEARRGRIPFLRADDLHNQYMFPNDPAQTDQLYRDKVVALFGTVVPHNMADLADGFKLFRKDPYVQNPVLLESRHELTWVYCHLASADHQKLADWQQINLVGIVEGKVRGDLVVRRCVVL